MEGDDRYNRQVYAVGEDAQAVLGATRLLLVGCGALGEEAAKNAVLMGVGRMLLRAGPHDSAARAAELAARLRELNPLVRVEESGPAEEAVRAGACNAVLVAGDEAMPMTEQVGGRTSSVLSLTHSRVRRRWMGRVVWPGRCFCRARCGPAAAACLQTLARRTRCATPTASRPCRARCWGRQRAAPGRPKR
jgi:hypothetical protein